MREREDHAIFSIEESRSSPSGKQPTVTLPSDVLRVRNRDDLHGQLNWYGIPLWKNRVPDTEFAHRWFVERIRPALRYYCKKYSVPVPDWLKSDDLFIEMPEEEKIKLFGPGKLRIREFQKIANPMKDQIVGVERGQIGEGDKDAGPDR